MNGVNVFVSLELDHKKLDKAIDDLQREKLFVPVTFDVDRKSFDSRVKWLKSERIAIPVTFEVDRKGLDSELKALKGERIFIPVEFDIDKSQLSDLSKGISVDVGLDFDENDISDFERGSSVVLETSLDFSPAKQQIDEFKRSLSVNSSISVNGGEQGSGMCCGAIVNAIDKLHGSIKIGLQQGSEKTVRDANPQGLLNTVTSPLRSVMRGAFEGVGQNLSRSFATQTAVALERDLNVSMTKMGSRFGEVSAKFLNNTFFRGVKRQQETAIEPQQRQLAAGTARPQIESATDWKGRVRAIGPSKMFFQMSASSAKEIALGFQSQESAVKESVLRLGNAAEDAARTSFGSIGYNIVEELKKGVSKYLGKDIQGLGSQIGLDLVTGVKRVLGIKSHSRVFKAIGKDIVAGLRDGLVDFEGTLEDQERFLNVYVKSIIETVSEIKPFHGGKPATPAQYLKKMFTEVGKTGVATPQQVESIKRLIPQVQKVGNLGAFGGGYYPSSNQIKIKAPKLQNRPKGVDPKDYEDIAIARIVIHEFTHAMQAGFKSWQLPFAGASSEPKKAKIGRWLDVKRWQRGVAGSSGKHKNEKTVVAAEKEAYAMDSYISKKLSERGFFLAEAEDVREADKTFGRQSLLHPYRRRFVSSDNRMVSGAPVARIAKMKAEENILLDRIKRMESVIAQREAKLRSLATSGGTGLERMESRILNSGKRLVDYERQLRDLQQRMDALYRKYTPTNKALPYAPERMALPYTPERAALPYGVRRKDLPYVPGRKALSGRERTITIEAVEIKRESGNILSNVVAGLRQGLGQWSNQILGLGKRIGSGLLTGIKKVLRIQSPSEEARQVMLNVIKGLINGGREVGPFLQGFVGKFQSALDKLKRLSSNPRPSQSSPTTGGAGGSSPGVGGFDHDALESIFSSLTMAASPLIITFLGLNNVLNPLIRKVADTLMFIEPVRRRFEVGAGSVEAGRARMGEIEDLSSRYRVPIETALTEYSKFQIAVSGTPLRGSKADDFFESLTIAIKGLGMSSEEAGRVFLAFNQIIQKGRLSAEEIRQQLAETGFPVIEFAKALNMSVTEFNELLDRGAFTAEEVFPKLAKQLRKDFGDAAKQATGDFLSGMIRVQNAVFSMSKAIGDMFGSVFAGISHGMASALEFVVEKMKFIVTVGSTFLIGFGVQAFIGLRSALSGMLSGSGALMEMFTSRQALLAKAITHGLQMMRPFLVVAIASLLDEVFGTKYSVFENLGAFFKNLIINLVYMVDNIMSALKSNQGLIGFANGFVLLGKAIASAFQSIPSGVVELTALMFILIQINMLLKLYIIDAVRTFTATLWKLISAMWSAVASGKGLSAIWGTLAGGMKLAMVGAHALLAVFVFLLAKSDFLNDLWQPLKDTTKDLTFAIQGMKNALDQVGASGEGAAKRIGGLKSKGVELNLKYALGFGGDSVKSDDAAIAHRNKIYDRLKEQGRHISTVKAVYDKAFVKELDDLGLSESIGAYRASFMTIAEENLYKNTKKQKEMADTLTKDLGAMGLSPNSKISFEPRTVLSAQSQDYLRVLFKNEGVKVDSDGVTAEVDSLKAVAAIDKAINEKRKERQDLGLIDTAEAKKQIGEIDIEIQKLQEERVLVVKPVVDIVNYLGDSKKAVESYIDTINQSADYSPAVKRRLIETVQPALDGIAQASKILEERGYIDAVDNISSVWKDVTNSLTDATKAYEKWQRLNEISTTGIKAELVGKNLPEPEKSRQLGELELKDLSSQLSKLEAMQTKRRESLAQLLSIEGSLQSEKKQELEELRKETAQGDIELAKKRLEVAEKSASERLAIEEYTLQKIRELNDVTNAQITIASQGMIERILKSQSLAQLSPERADFLKGQAQRDATRKQIVSEINTNKRLLAEIRATSQKRLAEASEPGKLSMPEYSAVVRYESKRIADAKAALATAKVKLLDEELAARKEVSSERLRINEYNLYRGQETIGLTSKENANLAEMQIILTAIAKTQKDLKVIGNDPVKARELTRTLREQEESLIAILSTQRKFTIEREKTARLDQVNRLKLSGMDELANLERIKAETDYTKLLIGQKQAELREYDKLNLSKAFSDRQYAEKRRGLIQEIDSLTSQSISYQIEMIEAQTTALNKGLDIEVEYREKLRGMLDSEREQRKQLLSATKEQARANSTLKTQRLEGKIGLLGDIISSNDDEKQKKRIEDYNKKESQNKVKRFASLLGVSTTDPVALLIKQSDLEQKLANEKLKALKEEQRLAKELLLLEQEQTLESKRQAIEQAKINELKAEQSLLQSELALLQAKTPQDVLIAQKGMAIAERGLELARQQVISTDNALRSQIEIFNKQRITAEKEQTSTLRSQSLDSVRSNYKSLPNVNPFTVKSERIPLIGGNQEKNPTDLRIPQSLSDLNSFYAPKFNLGDFTPIAQSIEDLNRIYDPKRQPTPPPTVQQLSPFEKAILEKLNKPSIERLEFNNTFESQDQEALLRRVRTQVVTDINQVINSSTSL